MRSRSKWHITVLSRPKWSRNGPLLLLSIHWLRVPQRITFKVAMLTYRALHRGSTLPYLASSFTCVADMPHRHSLPPLNGLTFQPAVDQQSEVVLLLLLVQRCGTTCQAMWHQLRRWRCSRTRSRRTCSAAATKQLDSEWHFLFPVISTPPEQWSLQVLTILGNSKNLSWWWWWWWWWYRKERIQIRSVHLMVNARFCFNDNWPAFMRIRSSYINRLQSIGLKLLAAAASRLQSIA